MLEAVVKNPISNNITGGGVLVYIRYVRNRSANAHSRHTAALTGTRERNFLKEARTAECVA